MIAALACHPAPPPWPAAMACRPGLPPWPAAGAQLEIDTDG